MEPGITWYDVLGAVPDAQTRTIKRKYQDKVALLRPELISGARPNVLAAVTRAQHLLDTAWGVLGDPDRRTRYDEAVGLRRSGGGLGQPGTGIESAGMAEADPGIVGELADGLLGGLLGLLPEELAPRRRRNRPGALPDVRGLFYPCAWRRRPGKGSTSGSSGSPSARWRSTGWWSIKIPGRRRGFAGATSSRSSSGMIVCTTGHREARGCPTARGRCSCAVKWPRW